MFECFETLKRRCEAAGLKYDDYYLNQGVYEDLPDEDRLPPSLEVYFPRGRRTRTVEIEGEVTATWFLREPFEKYRYLEGFEASWSPEDQVIECNLVEGKTNSLVLSEEGYRFIDLLQPLGLEVTVPLDPEERVEVSSDAGLRLSVGPSSNLHSMLSHSYDIGGLEDEQEDVLRSLTLRIEGVEVTKHEDAVEILERVGNSMLFQIDLLTELTLTLERERNSLVSKSWVERSEQLVDPLPAVRFEYDREAMSLYWYAKSASRKRKQEGA